MPGKVERNRAMLAARQAGRTYRSIAVEHGLSVERVRQLVLVHGWYQEHERTGVPFMVIRERHWAASRERLRKRRDNTDAS